MPIQQRLADEDLLDEANRALESVALGHMQEAPASSLSFGQKKLLELARVLFMNPTLLLMDEPAAGVNPTLLERLLATLRDFRGGGRTILIVEHNMRVITELCNHVYVMDHGRIVAAGSHTELVRGNALYARLAALQFTDGGAEAAPAA